MSSQPIRHKSLYFALTGTGAFVVACAAFLSYLYSLGLNGAPMQGEEVARRMVIILFLIIAVFELALYLLYRIFARMDGVILEQKKELEGYSHRLEELVADQLTKIRTVMTQFQAITENIPIVLAVLDKEGRVSFADGSGWAKFGLRSKDLVGLYPSEVIKSDEVNDCIMKALQGQRLVKTHKIKDSYFSTHYAPLIDELNIQNGVIIVAVDVTAEHADSAKA